MRPRPGGTFAIRVGVFARVASEGLGAVRAGPLGASQSLWTGSAERCLVRVLVEARERKLALFSRLTEWIGCFCCGMLVLCVRQA